MRICSVTEGAFLFSAAMDIDEDNVLDFDEDEFDLDADIKELVSANPTSSQDLGQTSTEVVYVTGGHMVCPVSGCNAGKFPTKGKFTRHWTERHTRFSMRYVCGLGSCRTACRRRYDMKMHIKDVHRVSDMRRVEELVSRCSQTMSRNRGFLPPGSMVYRGRTSRQSTQSFVTSSETSTTTTSSGIPKPNVSAIASSDIISTAFHLASTDNSDDQHFNVVLGPEPPANLSITSHQKISLQDYRLRQSSEADLRSVLTKSSASASTVSVPSTKDATSIDSRSTSSGTTTVPASSTTGVVSSRPVTTQGSQTSCLELPPLILPPLPESREELQAYIRWCCLSMDQIGRQREAAKQALTEMGSQMDEERKQRRKLESEVRRLQREISEMKWKDAFFATVFPAPTADASEE